MSSTPSLFESEPLVVTYPKDWKAVDAMGVPTNWVWPGDDVYDRLWVITFTGKTARFQDLPQRLMFQDSEK